MKCQNCGREMKNGARFCIGCGAQHDENGQLVGGKKGPIDYNKTMMASDMPQQNNGNVDYNKTMMTGSTGFKQYNSQQNQQNYEQYNYTNEEYNAYEESSSGKPKKKISPILIICPLVIVIALAVSLFGGKADKKKTNKQAEQVVASETATTEAIETKETEAIVSTVSDVEETEEQVKAHLKGYWSADAEYFYIDGEMQKDMWVGNEEYYVGKDGKKVVSSWVDNKYYVDATGKKARNEWIEFSYMGDDGQKKIGFYYVGEDGIKVTDTTIDGRYVNDEGCYFPESGEKIRDLKKDDKNIEDKKDVSDKDKTSEDNKSQSKEIETTKQQETTIPIPATTQPQSSYVSPVIAPTSNTTNVTPTSAQSSSEVKIVKTEKITDYLEGDDYDCSITLLKPIMNGSNADETENINSCIEDIMDAWLDDVKGVIGEYDTFPKSVTFNSATLGSVNNSRMIINLSGSVKPKSGSSKTIKYRITYDRKEANAEITQTK